MKASNSPEGRFAKLVEEFFVDRLIRQRNSSPQTVAAYRDCFRLLFEFARDQRNKPTESLKLADLDAPLVLAFSIISKRIGKTQFGAATHVWRPSDRSCGLQRGRSQRPLS